MNRFKIDLTGQDKTKIKAELLEKDYGYDLVRIDVDVALGVVDFLRRNKVFYLKVTESILFNEVDPKNDDQWVRLKQRIKKCNRCEKSDWKFITFIAKPLTNLEVLQELHKDDVTVVEE